MGHLDAKLDPDYRGGVELRASTALAAVKYSGQELDVVDLERLVRDSDQEVDLALYYFSRPGFSERAVSYDASVGIALFTFSDEGLIHAVNAAAAAALRPGMRLDLQTQASSQPCQRYGSGKIWVVGLTVYFLLVLGVAIWFAPGAASVGVVFVGLAALIGGRWVLKQRRYWREDMFVSG